MSREFLFPLGRCCVGTDRVIRVVEDFVLPLLDEMGLELVEVQFKQESGWVLRIFIDGRDGVSIDNCASVSRQVGTYLEVEDIIRHAYTLEVSSPGAERPLKRLEDFIRFSGKKVRVKLSEPVDNQRVFCGLLTGVDEKNSKITLAVDGSDAQEMEFDLHAVARARLSL
jgi:ribosome maturation factor RimP